MVIRKPQIHKQELLNMEKRSKTMVFRGPPDLASKLRKLGQGKSK